MSSGQSSRRISSCVTSSPGRQRSRASNRPGWFCRRMRWPYFSNSLVRRSNSNTAKRAFVALVVDGADIVHRSYALIPTFIVRSVAPEGIRVNFPAERTLFRMWNLPEEGLRSVGALTGYDCFVVVANSFENLNEERIALP